MPALNNPLLRRWRIGYGLAAFAVIAGVLLALDGAWPPPLDRVRQISTVVLDAQDRMLRAFATPPGIWRLPVQPEDVIELRRLLYGLYAVLRLHNAQEEESAFSLIPAGATTAIPGPG